MEWIHGLAVACLLPVGIVFLMNSYHEFYHGSRGFAKAFGIVGLSMLVIYTGIVIFH